MRGLLYSVSIHRSSLTNDMSTLSLYSPAKINVFLQIHSKRPDGYHGLASLFQAIDLYDTLHFSLADEDSLSCTDPEIPVDDRNLVKQAIQAFRQKTGLHTLKIKCHLEKSIPSEAGLGGGSGNAATTLWALNTLAGFPLKTKALMEIGGQLGSDIPFFLSKGTAYCTGRGECVRELPHLPSQNLWIVKPHYGLSTRLVYETYRSSTQSLGLCDPEQALEKSLSGDSLCCFNDLQAPAFQLRPELAELSHFLTQQNLYSAVQLCGSGTALFCLGESKPPVSDCKLFQASFINRSSDTDWYR